MMTSRRVFLTSTAATAVGLTLSACSQDLPPEPASNGTPSAYPVLDDERLTKALDRIQTGLDDADAQKNSDLLSGYLTGPALRVRTEEYALASAAQDDSKIEHFTTTSEAGTAGRETEFPRVALTVTGIAEGDDVPCWRCPRTPRGTTSSCGRGSGHSQGWRSPRPRPRQ